MKPFRIGLLITDKCNIECAHCWFGPSGKTSMSLQEAVGYINQAYEIPSVEWFSFTGGEPFLMPNMLGVLVRYAACKGFKTECVTNCFWSDTPKKARETLEPLVEAGLDTINLSCGDFHQSYIPFKNVKYAYDAAVSFKLKIVLMNATAQSHKLKLKKMVKLLDEKSIQIHGNPPPKGELHAIAVETGFIPVGRGSNIHRDEWMLEKYNIRGSCDLVLRDIGIYPNGIILPCCSASSILQNFKLDYACSGIEEVLKKAWVSPVFRALTTIGPKGLGKYIGLDSAQYVTKCHLCYMVLSHPKLDFAIDNFERLN